MSWELGVRSEELGVGGDSLKCRSGLSGLRWIFDYCKSKKY